MSTRKHTVSVRFEPAAKKRIERAAQLTRQSYGTFLGEAGEQRAREILLEWTIAQREQHETTFSELAEETGLAVEEIMTAMGERGQEEAKEMFLASFRTLAELKGDPEILKRAEAAAAKVWEERKAAS